MKYHTKSQPHARIKVTLIIMIYIAILAATVIYSSYDSVDKVKQQLTTRNQQLQDALNFE